MTRRHVVALAECVTVWAALIITARAITAWATYLLG